MVFEIEGRLIKMQRKEIWGKKARGCEVDRGVGGVWKLIVPFFGFTLADFYTTEERT